jgi:tetratricopeptide (TPR) repeat protein
VARYELANALFLVAGQPDSAAVWYRRVLQEDADVPVARRALYALAEVRYAEGDTARAADLYRRLLDEYPSSSFAPRARQRLGRSEPVTTDSLSLTKTAYATAFEAWQAGRLDTARTAMIGVVDRFDDRTYEARALLATAMIYLEQVRTRPEPVADTALTALLSRLDPSGETIGSALETIRREAAAPAASEQQGPRRGPAQFGGPEQVGAERSNRSAPRRAPSRTEEAGAERQPSEPQRAEPQRTEPERAEPQQGGQQQGGQQQGEQQQAKPEGADASTRAGQPARDEETREQQAREEQTGEEQTGEEQAGEGDAAAEPAGDSESSLGPYEPAVRLLAYVVAEYPDAPQSDRARSLAVAIYQSQTPIADAGTGDDSGDTADEGGETERARPQTGESQPQREAPTNRRDRPDDGPPVPSRAQDDQDDAVSDTASTGSRPADAVPDTSSGAPQRRFRFDAPRRPTPSPESTAADSARPQPVRIDTSRLRNGRVPAERDTAAAADSTGGR